MLKSTVKNIYSYRSYQAEIQIQQNTQIPIENKTHSSIEAGKKIIFNITEFLFTK